MQEERWRVLNDPRLMNRLSSVCQCCVSDGVPRRSLMVAAIVGTILNLINQGDILLNGGTINVAKVLLTYAVPYCVATYGAVALRLAILKDELLRHAEQNDHPIT
jgi:hypothetical protein